MSETAATLVAVRTDLSVTEGRVAIGVENEPTTVRLAVPSHEPLSRAEPALTIEVGGDGVQGSLRLDGDDVDALATVLEELTGDTEGDR